MSEGSPFTHTSMNGWYIADIMAAQNMTTTMDRRFIRMNKRKFSALDSVYILFPNPPAMEEYTTATSPATDVTT